MNKVVRFFESNELQTTKQKNFEIFSEIISMMNERQHLTEKGLDKIARLASKMNRQTRRRYLESSETIRQTGSERASVNEQKI